MSLRIQAWGRSATWGGVNRRGIALGVAASLLLLALVAGAVGHAAAAPSGGGVPYQFASLRSPNAVAATPTELLVLSSASCSTVYSVSPTGTVSTFATLATTTNKCAEQAIAISPGLGNFPAGEVYVLQQGSLYTIPAAGSTSPVPAALTLSNLSGGYASLAFDGVGTFGYQLLAIGGTSGTTVAIDPANHVVSIGAFGTIVEGPSVAPIGFGSVTGDVLAGAASHTTVYAMSSNGSVRSFAQWKNPEAVSFVPTLPCSFATTGDAYFVADLSDNAVLALPASTFSSVGSSGLVLGESHGTGLGLLAPNGTTSSFLPLSGTFEGASYVACPLGVAQTSDLTPHGLGGTALSLLGYDPAARDLVGADPAGAPSKIFLLNGLTGAFVRTVPVGVDPSAVGFNGKTNTLFVANSGSNNLTILNATTFAQLGSVPTGTGSQPVGVVFNPSNQKLYVANAGNSTVVVYSLVNNFFPNQNQVIPINGVPHALVYDPADNNIYVIGGSNGAGAVWEIHAFALVATLLLPAGPGGIAVNASSGALYVTLPALDQLLFVAPGDTLVTSVTVGNVPTGIAYNAFNGHLVVANVGDGTFTVLEGTHAVATYLVGANPGALVYDPADHLVYTAADVTLLGLDPRIILGTTS